MSFLTCSPRDSGPAPSICPAASVLPPPARRKLAHVIMIAALPSFPLLLYPVSVYPHIYPVRCSEQFSALLILWLRELRMAEGHRAPPAPTVSKRRTQTSRYSPVHFPGGTVPGGGPGLVHRMPPCDLLCSQPEKRAFARRLPVLSRIFWTPLEHFYRHYNVGLLFFTFLFLNLCCTLFGSRTLKYSRSKIRDSIYSVSLDDKEGTASHLPPASLATQLMHFISPHRGFLAGKRRMLASL